MTKSDLTYGVLGALFQDYKHLTKGQHCTLDSIFQFQNQMTGFGFLLAYTLPVTIVFLYVSH